MNNTVPVLMNKLNILISQQPFDNFKFQETLRKLDELISPQDKEYKQYSDYKSFIDNKCLDSLDLDDRQRVLYQQQQEEFRKKRVQYQSEETQEQTIVLNEDIDQKRKNNKNVYLILGNSGSGKSSIVQILTGNLSVEVGHGINSHTKKCKCFDNQKGQKFIDTPGINDTKKENHDILLIIVQYLIENNYQPEDIFIIYIQNKPIKISKKTIQELSYTYFLYELFKGQISGQEVTKLIEEYYTSKSLLNWTDCNFHQKQDELTNKRKEIFSQKDIALKYLQHFNNFHIVVKTFFDKTPLQNLRKVNQVMVDYLKVQIWSNKTENLDIFKAYKEYIKNQKKYLFNKIQQILELEYKNQNIKEGQQIQNIVLFGSSQVGKSSLIEQLTNLKGLRGSGEQSETSVCQIYSIEFQNIIYRFIDTPGFDGTEANQDSFHNLKIIADFLRRNQITEFKLLYMQNTDIEIRDNSLEVLKKFNIFIEVMFGKDITFVDPDYLKYIFEINSPNQEYKLDFIKEKVLKINRKIAQQDDYNVEEIFKDELKFLNVNFQSNFFTDDREFIEVNQEVDERQKNTLFNAINQIEYISIDEKITSKIKQENQIQIIDTEYEYKTAFIYILETYLTLHQLKIQIQQYENQNNNQQQLKEYIDQKIKIDQELNNKWFLLSGQIHKTNQIKSFIQQYQSYLMLNSHNLQIGNIEKLLIDIQRHFIILNFTPILFEAETNSKNIFLSRKQQYFWQYSHQLSKFIVQDNRNHQQILEDLAKIRIFQEIAQKQYLQQKYIDELYSQKKEDVVDWIEAFVSSLNVVIGTGIQIYRYASYFSLVGETALGAVKYSQLYKVAQGANILGVWVNSVLAAASIGIDIYSYSKGQICGKQMALNTIFNSLSGGLSIAAFFIPGVGWIVGGVAGSIALIGYGISAGIFTSSSTFDQTISLFFKNIIDDMKPNQNLLYFQKSQFLKKKYNLNKYSQLSQDKGYEMFRQLEKEQYFEYEQKKMLLKLFKNSQETKLRNDISYYIVSTYIYNKFQVQFQQFDKEKPLLYLEKIQRYMKDNEQLINTFYNQYDDISFLNKVKDSFEKVKQLAEDKLKYLKREVRNMKAEVMIWNDQEKQIIKKYEDKIIEFQNKIKNQQISYDKQKQFGDGFWRKSDRFPILQNSYCNLMQQKMNYLYNQQTISDLSKNKNEKCFQVNDSEKSFNNFYIQESKEKTNNLKQLLQISEKYITSRYLQKIKGEQNPNLTSLNQSEVLDCELEYSIDLHELAEISQDFNTFLHKTQQKAKEFKIQGDFLKRLQNFYESIPIIKHAFI